MQDFRLDIIGRGTSSIKIPFHSSFEILHLAVGTSGRMNAENRGPIWDAFRGGRGCGDGDLE